MSTIPKWLNELSNHHKRRPGKGEQNTGRVGQLKYDPDNNYHFFFGDETALDTFRSLKDQVNTAGQNYLCLLELEGVYAGNSEPADICADVVARYFNQPAKEAVAYLADLPPYWQSATFYLMGRASSLQVFHRALLAMHVNDWQIKTEEIESAA